MHVGLAALALALGGAALSSAQDASVLAGFGDSPTSRDYARLLQAVKKPGAPAGDDSCQYAGDMECDEPGLGTGACPSGTDRSDCWRVMTGVEDDSCAFARDGECDEPGFGAGVCTQGTDRTDCGPVAMLRFQTDSCETAFNGVCETPDVGTGLCEARTDRSDCFGRERPLTIRDHFFGRDDRQILDTAVFPWSVIGQISFDSGGACTASLIADAVVITAAHCIASETGGIDARGVFETGLALEGGPRQARIIDHLVDPDWDYVAFSDTDTVDGADWALLRLDTPLGAELGRLGVAVLGRTDRPVLSQAGYSWDTGMNLSGHLGCEIIDSPDDDTMIHNCDTTRGDSGSPFLVELDGVHVVVATDSNFRRAKSGPQIYVAARSDGWAHLVEDFAAGRIGAGGVRPRGPGKPGPLAPVKSD